MSREKTFIDQSSRKRYNDILINMAMVFKYKTIRRPDNTLVKTPSIPISLKGNCETIIEVMALLDSGADISVIPSDFAQLLNLDLNKERTKAFGIGGEVESIETSINLIISKGHENYSFVIPIKVILGDYDFPVILGRQGFFDKFLITFNQEQHKIVLKKYNHDY